MSDNTYNGWSNYETWNVKLWIDNDEGGSRYWQDQAEELLHYRHHNTPEHAVYELSKQLEQEVRDGAPDLGASCYADLLGAALSAVNWREIAESMISDAVENLKEA